jgi:hypothetical protein
MLRESQLGHASCSAVSQQTVCNFPARPALFLFGWMVVFDCMIGFVKTIRPFGTKFSTFVTVN